MSDFERALAFVLRWEGGYVNDPADPGGETNRGVTKNTYDYWRLNRRTEPPFIGRDGPGRSVRDITDAEVAAIYELGYWRPARCDTLAWPLCLIQFDTAVNMGVSRADRLLLQAGRDPSAYLHERRNYYTGLANRKPEMRKFLRGWLNRVDALATEAKL